MKKLTLITAILLTANLLFAQIINIPDDYPTIQQGIDAANEGDTVLVQPGIYVENIHLTKNLIIGSLLLTTQDTSYISQTIIDGNQAEPVIRIFGLWENSIDSTCIVAGFTIRNGHGYYDSDAGGIICSGASPTLKNLIISNNYAGEWRNGGGIGCQFGGYWQDMPSNPIIQDVVISNNSSGNYGGGLYCGGGNPSLINVVISNNSSGNYGGGLYCGGGNPSFINVIISKNSGDGLFLDGYEGLNTTLNDVIIKDNTGCGIRSVLSALYLSGVSITNNMGGLNSNLDEIVFDTINRCSIYNNYVGYEVKDISGGSSMEVVLDTFTVLTPTSFHVNQISNCSFDIWHGFFDQIDADVYISPEGDDNNSGINPDEPLKTIFTAQLRLLENYTIFLADGIYSSSLTGELFPIQLNNLNLVGGSMDNVVLNGSGSTVLEIFNNNLNMVTGLTITGGDHGIWMEGSNTIIENVNITNNSTQDDGGGLHILGSNPVLENVIVSENSAPNGGGIYIQESGPIIQNVTISNNTATDKGGGIYMSQSSSPTLKDVIIDGNSAHNGGGIHSDNSNPIIRNSTLVDNNSTSNYSGGIFCVGGSNINLANSVLWNNSPVQIFIQGVYAQNNVAISYSDIQDGEDGIVISGTGILDWQEGNINEDPMFVMSGDHPYQINDYSPCIDAGTPDTTGLNLPEFDLAGNTRFVNGRVDMGAYEWNIMVGQYETITGTIGLDIFPNPANDHLTIQLSLEKPETLHITLLNVSGQQMAVVADEQTKAGVYQAEIDISSWPSGVYFCRVKVGNEVVTRKIVKL